MANQALYNLIRKGFIDRGAAAGMADWGAALAMYESADGTSNVAKDNNLSGIKWARQKNAVQGRKSPEGNYYAKYKDLGSWLNDFIRVLKMNRSGKGAPYYAKDLNDFAAKLKMNGYYGDTLANYRNGLQAKIKQYSGANNPYQPPKADPLRPADKGTMRRQAQEEVRTGVYKQNIQDQAAAKQRYQTTYADDGKGGVKATTVDTKPGWSLSAWFEGLSSLNKALVIGVGGWVLSRIVK